MNIKEAIESSKSILNQNPDFTVFNLPDLEREALQVLISLTERVENIKGLPKKKEKKLRYRGDDSYGANATFEVGKIEGRNQVIDECKLYIAKMFNEKRIKETLQLRYFKLMAPNITESDAEIVADVLAKAIDKELSKVN